MGFEMLYFHHLVFHKLKYIPVLHEDFVEDLNKRNK